MSERQRRIAENRPPARRVTPRLLGVSVVLAAAGLAGWSATEDAEAPQAPAADYDPLTPAALVLTLSRERLEIRGHSASANHERALRQLAARRFPGVEAAMDLKPQVLLPEHWDRSSLAVLEALAATHSASARLEPYALSITGVTTDAPAFAMRLDGIRAILPNEARLRSDVIAIDTAAVTPACRGLVETIGKHRVGFEQSSADIRTASFGALDRLADAAERCPSLDFKIGGHTDSAGDPDWNLRLSESRAQAVADYLIRRGVASDRLLVAGYGDSRPIANNDTPYGRSLNRRIEIEIAGAARDGGGYRPGSASSPTGLSRPSSSTSNTSVALDGITPRLRSP